MSSFEDWKNKDAWKDLYEKSKAREEEEKRKMVDNRPKTLEEMMKMRDLETSNIDYHPQRSPEDQGMGTYVEKSNDQRFAEMIEKNNNPDNIQPKIFKMCIGNQEVNCKWCGSQETYPPIYCFEGGFTLPGVSNGFTLPNTFEFQAGSNYTFSDTKIVFKLEYGDNKFEVNIKNKVFMKSIYDRNEDERLEALGIQYRSQRKLIIFSFETGTGRMAFEINPETNLLEFVEGKYPLTIEQNNVFERAMFPERNPQPT